MSFFQNNLLEDNDVMKGIEFDDWMPFADSTAADQTFANSYAPIWHLPIKTKTAANQTKANNFSYDINQSWH